MFTLSSTDCLSRCNVTAAHQWYTMHSMQSLLEQSSLDLLPGVPAALVCVHAKQDAQPTCQAAGLLLQEIWLRLSFETFKMNTHKQVFTAQHIKVFEFLSVKPKETPQPTWCYCNFWLHDQKQRRKDGGHVLSPYLLSTARFFARCWSWKPWQSGASPAGNPAT